MAVLSDKCVASTSIVKQPPGIPEKKYENNVELDVTEICCYDGRWIELAQVYIQQRVLV
jgi:hypothetical protein